ncbi:hypothetical protein H072_3360 [Dactylellina haptotyla CBS 200.50]|uniref:dolichyl-phosphate-mannose--protein mannosyltransferase n=1 Tax=Dactylellina haptotyla (strain CBS 200.50) TaxID=1284197 RepID=S8C4J8_DACHA|nr:hypothetical protein H072_3360 [Dactylellina haptotyla CBS 200.50]
MTTKKKSHNLAADHDRGRSRSRSPTPNSPSTPTAAKRKGGKGTSSQVNYWSSWTTVKDYDIFNLPSGDWSILIGLTVVAVFVRLFRIHQPTSVVFDEVHFGGFATKYIKGKFFMDVHPPLAKLLITLAGFLAGFDGSFDFKEIGKDYLEPGVPYVAMRLLPAILGIFVVPTAFLTLKASGCSTIAAVLGAGFITFENGLVTQSRLILLDSPLVCFTALTALSWTSFMNQHALGPGAWFGPNWWFWLAASGLGLGATLSVKWVGLFTIAWVGSITVLQLWLLLGDTKQVSIQLWAKHVAARALCLIALPMAFYMFMFWIHFLCLQNPGDGDGFMSAQFQSTLNSKQMKAVPADVAYGSKITLRHWNTQGGYLHSHNHMYPSGSKQQQITLYPHKDDNNFFTVENTTKPEGGVGISGFDAITPPVLIKNGDTIKLYHNPTHRRVHSHDVRPPVTDAEWQNEVSAYGYEGFEGDANDYFRVEIIKSMSKGSVAKERLRTIETRFKLVHVMTGCVLFSHKVKLPSWGYEQQEVTCAKGGTLPNSVWFVEQNVHPQMTGPDVEMINYKNPGFFGKFWELQKVMWRTNAGLVDSHAWDSRPDSWPILKRGINFWGRDHRQVYLMGNPLIWYSATAAVLVYLIFKAIAVLRWQRGFKDYDVENFRRFDFEIGANVLGWAFHYFPFFLMKRQLFLHHYFPALFFGIIAVCQIWDFIFTRLKVIGLGSKPSIGMLATVGYLSASIIVFYLFSPIAYGNQWTKAECKRVKLFTKWDWDCNSFFDTYEQYSKYTPAKSGATDSAPSASAAKAGEQHQVHQEIAPSGPDDVQAAPEPEKSQAAKLEDAAKLVGSIVSQEEKIEYRDQDGNLLPEEEVSKLMSEGVSFETKFATKTRVIDQYGNEIDVEGDDVDVVKEDTVAIEPEAIEPSTDKKDPASEAAAQPIEAEAEKNTKSRNFEAEEPKAPEPPADAPAASDAPSDEPTFSTGADGEGTVISWVDPEPSVVTETVVVDSETETVIKEEL